MIAKIADTGLYAVIDGRNDLRPIRQIGYNPGSTVYTPPGVVVLQPLKQLIAAGQNPLEALLNTMYGFQVSLTSEVDVQHDLHGLIKAAKKEEWYDAVQVVDFMALTGAIKRYQTLPNGSIIDLLSDFEPKQKRPNINALERNGNELMFSIIKHLGLWGLLPYLYAKEGITFDDLNKCIKEWITEESDRRRYVVKELIPLLRTLRSPVLTEAMVRALILS